MVMPMDQSSLMAILAEEYAECPDCEMEVKLGDYEYD